MLSDKQLDGLVKEVLSIYIEVDKRINPILNVCKKACNYCCYQSVNVFVWEEPSVIKAVNDMPTVTKINVRSAVEKWFEVFNEHTPEADKENPLALEDFYNFEKNFRHLKVPCPLLNEEGLCSIYQSRPLACRSHIVSDDPNKCRDNPHRESIYEARKVRDFVINNVRILPEYRLIFKPIAYLITDVVGARVKSKPFTTAPRHVINNR